MSYSLRQPRISEFLKYGKNESDNKDIKETKWPTLTIVTINIDGNIQTDEKFKRLQYYIKETKADIIFLQEPNLTEINKEKIKKKLKALNYSIELKEKPKQLRDEEAKQRAISALIRDIPELEGLDEYGELDELIDYKSVAQGGLISMFSNTWKDKIKKTISDPEEFRFLLTPFQVSEKYMILLANIYAPSGDKKKNDNFFQRIGDVIEEWKSKCFEETKVERIDIIAAGDMNAYAETIDKRNKKGKIKECNGFRKFIERFQLVDIIRKEKGRESEIYTCRRMTKEGEIQETRIDYVLASNRISKDSKSNIFKYDKTISPDHAVVVSSLMIPMATRETIDHQKFTPHKRSLYKLPDKEKLHKIFKVNKISKLNNIKELHKSFKEGIELGQFSTEEKAQNLFDSFHEEVYKILENNTKREGLREGYKENNKFIKDFKFRTLKDIKNKLVKWKKKIEKKKTRIGVENREEEEKLKSLCHKLNQRLLSIYVKDINISENNIKQAVRKIQNKMERRKEKMNASKFVSAIENRNFDEKFRQRKYFQNIMDEDYHKAKLSILIVKNKEGENEIITDAEKIRDKEWPEYTKKIFSSKKKEPQETEGLPYATKWDQRQRKEIETDFNISLFEERMKKLARNKAPGPDEVKAEVYQSLSEDDIEIIGDLVKFSWDKAWIPRQWRKCLIQHIEKSQDNFLLDNWRPISLLDSSYKIFTGLIQDPLYKYMEENEIISNFQFGFMKKRSIQQEQILLTSMIEDSKKKNKPLYGIFLDFKKAFDSMEVWALIRTLELYQVPKHLIDLIKEIYYNNHAELLTPVGKSKTKVQIERGIRQGDVLSPLLFIIFINPLLKRLEEENIGYELDIDLIIAHLSYADDINIFVKTEEEAKRAMEIIKEFCDFTGMEINLTKTFATSLNGKKEFIIHYNGSQIKQIDDKETFRFLGAKRNLQMDWTDEESRLKAQLGLFIEQIRKKKLTVRQKVDAINILLVPKIANTLSFAKLSDTFSDLSDKKMCDFIKGQGQMTWNYKNEKLQDERTWGLKSIKDIQKSRLSSTIYHQMIQSKNPEVRKVINFVEKNGDEKNTFGYFKETMRNHGFEVNINNSENKFKIVDFMNKIEYEKIIKEKIEKIKDGGVSKYIFATDGSLITEDGKVISVASAILYGSKHTDTYSWRTKMNQTVFNSEIQALELIYLIIEEKQINEDTIILMDSLSVINALKGFKLNGSTLKNKNGFAIERTVKLQQRMPKVELLWIPSHINLEDEADTKTKREQLEYLQERFGREELIRLIEMNRKVDFAASQGHKKGKINTQISREQNLIIRKIIEGDIFEGNLNREIGNKIKGERKTVLEEEVKKKTDPNGEIDLEATFEIFKEKCAKNDAAMETMFKLQSGGFKSPNNQFDIKGKTQIQSLARKSNFNNDKCDVHKDTLCETSHILFTCENAHKMQTELLKDVNKIVGEETMNIPLEKRGINMQVVAWWEQNPTNFFPPLEIEENFDDDVRNEDDSEEIPPNNKGQDGVEEALLGEGGVEEIEEEYKSEEEETGKKEKKTLRQTKLWDKGYSKERRKNMKKLLIEKQKIGTENLKRKREETEKIRKKEKRRRKILFTDKELGCKGYVNKTLKTQINLITKNNKKVNMKIFKRIMIRFMKYIEEMYRSFWIRYNKNLVEEGIKSNKLIINIRDNGFT